MPGIFQDLQDSTLAPLTQYFAQRSLYHRCQRVSWLLRDTLSRMSQVPAVFHYRTAGAFGTQVVSGLSGQLFYTDIGA